MQSPPMPTIVLTPRETECLQLVAVGLTNREIAGRLGISHRTVRTHLYFAYAKLGASNRAHATLIVERRGLIGDLAVAS